MHHASPAQPAQPRAPAGASRRAQSGRRSRAGHAWPTGRACWVPPPLQACLASRYGTCRAPEDGAGGWVGAWVRGAGAVQAPDARSSAAQAPFGPPCCWPGQRRHAPLGVGLQARAAKGQHLRVGAKGFGHQRAPGARGVHVGCQTAAALPIGHVAPPRGDRVALRAAGKAAAGQGSGRCEVRQCLQRRRRQGQGAGPSGSAGAQPSRVSPRRPCAARRCHPGWAAGLGRWHRRRRPA